MGSAQFEAAGECLADYARDLSQSVDGTPAQLLQYALSLLPSSVEVGWCAEHEADHFLQPDGACAEDTSAPDSEE